MIKHITILHYLLLANNGNRIIKKKIKCLIEKILYVNMRKLYKAMTFSSCAEKKNKESSIFQEFQPQ